MSYPRILIVEDDAAVRRALQLMLVALGYDVRAYASGMGLAADAEVLRSDCLVVDLVMPDIDGLELLHQLRGQGWSGPAILISGHLTVEWEAKARSNGFAAVLEKPISHHALDACLKGLLARNYGA